MHGDQRRSQQGWSEWARTVVLGELAVARAIAGDSIRIDLVLHSNDHGDDELRKKMSQLHLHLNKSGEGGFSGQDGSGIDLMEAAMDYLHLFLHKSGYGDEYVDFPTCRRTQEHAA